MPASLYAYERLVPHAMTGKSSVEEGGGQLDGQWDAINDLFFMPLRVWSRRRSS
ncbi:MAG: hypothetical protein Q8M01_10395 [Rubrivivax sp.]|nr:hypothetical protein [Rubrivivax sp.]